MAAGDRYHDRSQIDETLKIDYEPVLQKAYADRNWLMQQMYTAAKKSTIRGKYLQIEVELGPLPGGAFGGEKTVYPYPNIQDWEEFHVRPAWLRGTGEFTKQSEDDSKEGRLAWVQSQRKGMLDLVNALHRRRALQFYSNRYTPLALVSTDSYAAGLLNLVHAAGAPNAADAWSSPLSDMGARHLIDHEYVQILAVNPADGAPTYRVGAPPHGAIDIFKVVRSNYYQVALDPAPIAFGAPGAPALNDYVIPAESFNQGADDSNINPRGFGPYGLLEVIHDGVDGGAPTVLFGDYGGLNRAANPIFNSVCLNKAGLALAEDDLANCCDAVEGKTGLNIQPTEWVIPMHRSVFRLIKKWNENEIRYEPREAPLGMPDKAVSWTNGGQPLRFEIDPMCPPRTVFGIHRAGLKMYENIALEFVDEDGSILRPVLSSGRLTDVWQYHMRNRYQIFDSGPQRNFRIGNISGTDPQYNLGTAYLESL